MYEIHFRKDKDDYILIAKGLHTLEQACSKRQMSGDLVVDEKHQVVVDPSWLFDWEKKDPTCYAQRAIQAEALSLKRRK
jgi:hypothetical protein